jgi:hypothetical protein
MRRGAGLASAELTFLSRFGATSAATNGKGLVSFGFHSRMMNRCAENG